MKGPFERHKYDLRRLWECPLCRQRERTEGNSTACFCKCQEKEEPKRLVAMRLIGDGARKMA